jgi:hypothetical protein
MFMTLPPSMETSSSLPSSLASINVGKFIAQRIADQITMRVSIDSYALVSSQRYCPLLFVADPPSLSLLALSTCLCQEEAEFHPLILFKQHAVQTNEIFLLVADLFARFCSSLDRSGGDLSAALSTVLAPYETFQRNLWWDVAVGPAYEQEKLQHTLRQLVSEAWELLNRAFRLEERGIAGILSAEYIARFGSLSVSLSL